LALSLLSPARSIAAGAGERILALPPSILSHELDAERRVCPTSKEPAREVVGELAVGIVFLYQVYELREAVLMQACQVLLVEGLAELTEVRPGPDLFWQTFGGRVVLLEALRIVTN